MRQVGIPRRPPPTQYQAHHSQPQAEIDDEALDELVAQWLEGHQVTHCPARYGWPKQAALWRGGAIRICSRPRGKLPSQQALAEPNAHEGIVSKP